MNRRTPASAPRVVRHWSGHVYRDPDRLAVGSDPQHDAFELFGAQVVLVLDGGLHTLSAVDVKQSGSALERLVVERRSDAIALGKGDSGIRSDPANLRRAINGPGSEAITVRHDEHRRRDGLAIAAVRRQQEKLRGCQTGGWGAHGITVATRCQPAEVLRPNIHAGLYPSQLLRDLDARPGQRGSCFGKHETLPRRHAS